LTPGVLPVQDTEEDLEMWHEGHRKKEKVRTCGPQGKGVRLEKLTLKNSFPMPS